MVEISTGKILDYSREEILVLFNSPEFIFFFLPTSIFLFILVHTYISRIWAIFVLSLTSILFYSWWDYHLVWVILTSITVNFATVRAITASAGRKRKWVTALGICFNLSLLSYYKYWGFAYSIFEGVSLAEFSSSNLVVPIGISFYTFQQIAFLVDTHKKEVVETDPRHYMLFVSFFPQLIAGPIVHHREMMPQFRRLSFDGVSANLAVGVTIFVIGLSKKILLADGFANIASPYFDAAAGGKVLDFWEAWVATFAYTFQIYFDFSGYSDMAIGLARMFGIHLPINFASPYKAVSMIDFWQRWHITLSRFLRDYVYFPLGGSRKGRGRTYLNVIVTMLLGGFWHGAGWTFLLWGAIHAVGIMANRLWREFGQKVQLGRRLGWLITFGIVTMAWVPFRADTITVTGSMYASMVGLNGISIPTSLAPWLAEHAAFARLFNAGGVSLLNPSFWMSLLLGFLLVLAAPNTQTLLSNFEPGLKSPGYPNPVEKSVFWQRFGFHGWMPTPAAAVFVGLLFTGCMAKLNDVSEFIYFQF